MYKYILIIIAGSIAALLAYAAKQPDTFRIERSTSIQAPPEKIFAVLNDFRQSISWSPYEMRDPAMKRNFSGPATGKGSVYEFDGNKEVGTGRIEIMESVPPTRIVLQLDMIKPFEGSNTIEYTLRPVTDGTEVSWAMYGEAPFISKVICIFMDMDKMVGADFEKGLANLKSLVETGPAQ
ncbi:MAG TPA: SRPBCC family protein [Gammaproteobacteria bacterium]